MDAWIFLAHMGLFLFGFLNPACTSMVELPFQHR